ncbi:conjugative transposon TraM protein [Flavobacterium sp. 270]|uniref:conjugative transposon protein TraM n=1 Tax=Flavobacterium sp. 270 TaxID=2512114 RepID=UPI00106567B7|nr:conjugative transposon protein TraM [Flavobacterium sp. 270]TDW46689.1 conjugative transposon TraM protein [Flavobacterium sp. 270]
MKEDEKKAVVLLEGNGQSKVSKETDDKRSTIERFKKTLIFILMGIVFLGSMYLIFKPSSDKKGIENIGMNDTVPQATEEGMQADKQKAYEKQILEEKEQQKRDALTTLADYWNEGSTTGEGEEGLNDDENQNQNNSNRSEKPVNPALNSYRNAQSTLGSFYQDDNGETQELRKQFEELKEKMAEKEVPAGVTVSDQLALMEKSYQMAAKYLPSGTKTAETTSNNVNAPVVLDDSPKKHFAAFTSARKNTVSSLYREPADSAFIADWSEIRNRSFYTEGSAEQMIQPKNSITACVQETQTIVGESSVRLRLLEPAQTGNLIIAKGTILTANAKLQGGRVELKITSIEQQGNIIPVQITVYDLDGQQGLYVPYSPEMNALSEMAGNMSQTSGTSLMLTQSAGQQAAADLSRGVVQGISGYFSKKVRTPKVTLKAGHQVFLVPKK